MDELIDKLIELLKKEYGQSNVSRIADENTIGVDTGEERYFVSVEAA